MEDRHIIWSNENLDLDDWREDLQEQYPDCSEDELYRIMCMLMIVAHHFVVNSGLTAAEGPMAISPTAANTLYLWMLGMWGKTGINCFLLITGYFMCKSSITLNKFIKLMLWIYRYKIIIFCIFLTTGYETLSIPRILSIAWVSTACRSGN